MGYGRYMKFRKDLTITQDNYIASQRLKAIALLEDHGWRAVRTAYGVSRSTVYLWRKGWKDSRYQASALIPESTRPQRTRRMETDPRVVGFITDLRKRYPRIGKAKIKPLLDEHCVQSGITTIAEPTIGKVIKRYRLFYPRVRRKTMRKTPRKRISSRVEAKYPGELVQIDSLVRFEAGVTLYLITAIDLFSRFSFALSYRSLSSRAALDFYQKLERSAPFTIKAVKTDNGAEFLGEFDRYLQKKGVTHYFSYPRTPKSNPYIERFNRTLQEEFVEYHLDHLDNLKEFNDKLIDYLLFFNAVRPHQALKYLTPLGYLVKEQLLSNMSVSYTPS